MSSPITINNTTRASVRVSLFNKAQKSILPKVSVSLALVSPSKARAYNMRLRAKNYVPNVLSYLLSKDSGEIILCPLEIKKQAPSYGLTYSQCMLYMFIHALLHLKGRQHGTTMEREEWRLLKAFYPTITIPTNEAKNRRRN
jgi:rRNA maturation RNase YbeY